MIIHDDPLNTNIDRRWWRLKSENEVCQAAFGNASSLITDQKDRVGRLYAWHEMYVDLVNSQSLRDSDGTGDAEGARRGRARFNVAQNAVDSVHSKISKHKPAPKVATLDGDYQLQNKAQKFTSYIEGDFERIGAYEKGSECLHDACIFGTSALKYFEKNGRPEIEVVWAGELYVDPRESRQRHVRTLYQIQAVDREVLAEKYPGHDLKDAAGFEPYGESQTLADLVLVVEAWHLPSGPDAGDGRHVICTSNALLLDNEWEKDKFPFVFLHYTRNPLDFWGVGLIERVAGAQGELNRLTQSINDAFRLSVPSVWIETNSNIQTHQLDNEPWRVYKFTGTPPIFSTPAAVDPQHLMREQALIDRAYEMQGVSQLSAASQKPAGLNSGKALRTYSDIETERFRALGEAYETFYIELAEALIELTEDIVRDDEEAAGDLEVIVGKDTLRAMKYSDIRMGDNPYRIRVFPVSKLSNTFSGRLQDIQDLVELGVIQDPNEIADLLDSADISQRNNIELAGRKLADKLIESCLDGTQEPANPYLPYEYTRKRANLSLMLAEREGAPDTGLQNLRDFIAHLESIQQQAMAAAAPPPQAMSPAGAGPAPVGPEGAPMPAGPVPMPVAG